MSHDETKCLCAYCSGAIARGMKKINDENLAEAYRLIESNSFDDEQQQQQFSTVLDSLNPAQCFDIFERLCAENRWTKNQEKFDDLLIFYVKRFRINGGFFLALKEPRDERQHLLNYLRNFVLINEKNAELLNLTVDQLD